MDYKFRGKRTNTEEWVFGYYTKEWYRDGVGGSSIRHYIYDFNIQKQFRVIPETVGQFTGFTDINSKEIYHKDIVAGIYYGYSRTGIVEWDKRLGKWIVDYNGNYDDLWTVLRFCQGEVIGNIHDNPSLITPPGT